jgi:predicted O-methyltransferase YrrM
MSSSNPLRAPPHISSLLTRLHDESSKQEATITPEQYQPIIALYKTDPVASSKALDDLMRDKFIALEQDKAEFVYQTIISSKALNVVEAGTSYGVSTIYLSLAIAEVEKLTGQKGRVIATEKEPEKAARARHYWEECGKALENRIDLREGDLTETLKTRVSDVDLLLLDSMSSYIFPGLKRVVLTFRQSGHLLHYRH